jgi:hypothetical protein
MHTSLMKVLDFFNEKVSIRWRFYYSKSYVFVTSYIFTYLNCPLFLYSFFNLASNVTYHFQLIRVCRLFIFTSVIIVSSTVSSIEIYALFAY